MLHAMQRVAVDSSAIAEIGYDPSTRVLEILFKSRLVYRYLEVPAAEHAALLAASSIGQHYNRHIRNTFEFVQVDP